MQVNILFHLFFFFFSSREEKRFCLPFYQSAILGCQRATLENQGFY